MEAEQELVYINKVGGQRLKVVKIILDDNKNNLKDMAVGRDIPSITVGNLRRPSTH